MIPDFTSEFGTKRCLVILGIPNERFCDPKRVFRESTDKPSFALRHLDVEILAIEVLESSFVPIIEGILTQLTEKIGTPVQIVADHGSDLKSGIERYQQKNSNVIYTHDVTHLFSILFKKALGNDPKYQSFCQKCSLTRNQIQQTHLHFLTPPKQNYKSRYLNVDDYVKWANQVLVYQAKNDYSQISQVYSLDEHTYATLTGQVDKKTLFKLKLLGPQTYADRKSFIESITAVLGHRVFQKMGSIICQAASLGQRKFQKNLGWLEEYRQELITYTEMVDLALHVEAQIKNFGLNKESKALFSDSYLLVKLTPRSQHFKQQVIDYLARESAKVPENHTLLATSDVIESLFGKYKQFTSTNCLKEFGKRILTIPLSTLSITGEFVKNALESVSERDIENWAKDVFGQSVLSKRREAFQQQKKDTKVA